VGTFLSHIIAELSLKKIGVRRLKIGWFWLIEILLSIIIIKYIENIIEAIIHLGTGTWSPGQAFEGITGMLAIASAVIVGVILFLLYSGKIKVEDRHSDLMFFETVSIKDLEKQSLLDGFRKEIVIICGPSTEFIIPIMESILRSKEMISIGKLSILSQDFETPSHFDGSEKPKNIVTKGILMPLSKDSEENLIGSDPTLNQCCRLFSHVNGIFRQEFSDVIDFRMTKQPIYKSGVFIISYDSNKRNRYTELYTEPFILIGMDHQQIAYRFKSIPKSKISNEMTQYDLFEVEYSNFLKCWESTTTSEKHTT
jgi:hypothetical protein